MIFSETALGYCIEVVEFKMKTMTDEQAYAAMYYFLDQYYQRTKSDEVGAMLSGMSLLDGEPADAAFAGDWEDAVQFALAGGKADDFVLTPPDKSS